MTGQVDTCSYCERPAVSACLRREGPRRTDMYDARQAERDRSTVTVVRFCEVEHFHQPTGGQ